MANANKNPHSPNLAFKDHAEHIFQGLQLQANKIVAKFLDRPHSISMQLTFRDLGKAAGQAHYNRKGVSTVTLNPQLADYPDELLPTIAHEMAHVLTEFLRHQGRVRSRRGQWAAHGAVWKDIARALGDTGDRCHRLGLKATRTVKRRFVYRASCGTVCHFTAIRHNRIQKGATYTRPDTGGRITAAQFVEELE